MNFILKEKKDLKSVIQQQKIPSGKERLKIIISLSIPAIIAQISAIVMQYIDAAMVGSLGADPAASIGLVTTSTWIFFGLCSACAIGFSVQVAHSIGAGDDKKAKDIFRQSLVSVLLIGLLLAIIGGTISFPLPQWLGGEPAIRLNASLYFLVTTLAMPVFIMSYLSSSMLRCSGNMLFPGIIGTIMCILDVCFNFFLIFPTREIQLGSYFIRMPGFGLGVWGAALGTSIAELVGMSIMLCKLIFSKNILRLYHCKGSFKPTRECLRKAFKIGSPMGIERFLTSGAQVMLTIIVAPLGAFSIAANAFAVIAESICYMPGFGISDATTTVVGQSLGAKKSLLARKFAYSSTILGAIVMTFLGVLMWLLAGWMMEIMSPDKEIIELGKSALRIEAWAEPMYAVSIVAYGAFVGAGDTLIPCFMNLGCMWGIRVILASLMAPVYGLNGVWIAMAIELSCRGLFFLIRLRGKAWMNNVKKIQ